MTKFEFRYEILHRTQVEYGPKPETPWVVAIRDANRAVMNFQDVPAELVDLPVKMNAEVGNEGISEGVRRHWAIAIHDTPANGFDAEAGVIFPIRRVDATGTGSRKAWSRRQILTDSPALAEFLDRVNGTSGPVEMTPDEREAQQRRDHQAALEAEAAAQAARETARVRQRHEEAVLLAQEALETDNRRRAAALLKALAVVHVEPDVLGFLETEDDVAEPIGVGD